MKRGAKRRTDQYQLFERGKRDSRPLESATQRAIKEYCAYRNILCIRLNAGEWKTADGYYIKGAPAGAPDLYTLYKGFSIFIETKRIGENPEPHQVEMHKLIGRNLAFVVVADDLLDVERAYKEIDRRVNAGELPDLSGVCYNTNDLSQ